MAAGTSAPTPSTPPPGGNRSSASGRFIEYDRYIESQIRRTRRQVKGLDLTAAIMTLAAGSMVYFLLAALADHWLVPGGMGFAGRFACLTIYIVGAAGFAALKVGPLFLRRINPVYAAQAIERNRPGLKNSLVNFLLLRSRGAQLPQRIYEAIEEQAATGLSAANVETALDRGPLVKLLSVLMVLLCAAALYGIFSPKNLFTSFRRVIHPWADISAPTRVIIGEIQPGDTEGFHDQHLNVSALASGLSSGEAVTLHYSTADGQTVDQRVRMTLPESGYRYTGELPADAAGLQQDVIYWITAGDAISPEHRVTVHTAPSIVVDAVEYDYPAYSEISPRRTPKHGNIQALEGTRVTIRATASHEIRSADLDFDCDGRRDLAMKIDGRKASVEFPLTLKAGTDQAEHESYQLRFRNLQGHENPKPIRYAIEVIRDVPPEIAIVEPRLQPTEQYNLMAGESLPLALTASDPDFKLADIRLHVRRGREKLLAEPLLTEARGGNYRRRFVFSTRQFKLKPGETLSLWAAAEDNRQPEANRVETPHYTLRVVSPDGDQKDDQLADARDKRESKPNSPQQPGDSPSDEGESADQDKRKSGRGDEQDQEPAEGEQDGENHGDEGKSGGKSSRQDGKRDPAERSSGDQGKSDRMDPEKDAGRAIDEINKFFEEKQKEKEPDGDDHADDKRPDEKQRDEPQPDKRQKQPKQDESNGERGEQPDKNQSAGQDEGGSSQQKQQGGGGKSKPQEQRDPQGDKGEEQQGKSSGDKPAGNQKPGQEENAQGRQGESKRGESKRGESKRGDEPDEKMPREQAGEGDSQQEQKSGDGPEKFSAGKKRPEQGEQAGDEKKPGEQGADQEAKQGAGKQGDEMGAQQERREDRQKPSGEKKPSDNDQQPGPGKAGGAQDNGKPKRKNDESQAGGEAGKSGDNEKTQSQAGDAGGSGQERGMKEQSGEKGQQGEAAEAGDETPKDAEGNQRPQPGKGGQSRGKGDPDKNPNGDKKDPNQDVEGGDPEGQDRGKGGAGKAGGNKEPVASPRAPNHQKDKQKTSDDEGRANTDEEGNSGTESDRQSDSESDKSGDMSGGGGQGGGQRSKSPGKGSAGQNTDAEQGGGQSEQTGHGPTSEKGGDQKKGNKRSGGDSSGEKGEGSNKREGGSKSGQGDDGGERQVNQDKQGGDMDGRNEQGRPASQQEGEKKPGEPQQGQKQEPSRQQGQKPGQSKQQSGKENAEQQPDGSQNPNEKGGNNLQGKTPGGGRTNPTGGGLPGPDNPAPPAAPSDMSEPGGEDPNLEYTRKATDLALERLKDQLDHGQPDQDLLDKLKWSRKDVEEFVRRWDALKKSARSPGPQGDAAREQLDETLRSLGLRPRGSSVSGGQKRGDQSRNLIESRRSAPPPEYAEQYREFSKGLSKGRK